MAKLEKNVTVTVKSGDTEATYFAPAASISGTGTATRDHLSIQLFDYKNRGMTTKLKPEEPQKPSVEDKKELKRQQHADTIVGVLKDLETAKINAVAKRAKVEAEIAAQERAEKTALMFAVHGAIQAGFELDDVVQDMRDDYAGYVSDMYDQVYVATDLDTVVNVD